MNRMSSFVAPTNEIGRKLDILFDNIFLRITGLSEPHFFGRRLAYWSSHVATLHERLGQVQTERQSQQGNHV